MTAGAWRYRVHDIAVESELRLNAPPDQNSGPPQVRVVHAGRGSIPSDPPAGTLIAAVAASPDSFYIAEQDSGFVLRYEGACECRIDRSARRMQVTVDESAPEDLAGTIVGSGALAFLAMRRGASIFHASAVMLDDAALIALGDPGAGKTTTAAELCLGGARLLADDAVRVAVDADGAHVWASATALRLRPSAAEALAAHVPALELSATVEGRLLLRPPPAPPQRIRLAAVLIPRVEDGRRELSTGPLSLRTAMVEAIRHPRIGGFIDGRHLVEHLTVSSELVERVPFFVLRRPPSPLAPAVVIDHLRDQLAT
jgi:hypothetical protein